MADVAIKPSARRRSALLIKALIPLALAGLSACAMFPAGPDYRPPASPMLHRAGSQPLLRAGDTSQSTLADAQPLPDHWWRLYRDDRLDGLVRQALTHNTDLRIARADLERELALLKEAGSARYPTLSANAEPSFGHPSGVSLLAPDYVPPNTWNYDSGLNLSYQVDLFGQIQRAIEAAGADSQAAQAALDLVKINVAANTARAYAEACATGLQLQTAGRSIDLQQQSVTLTDRLLQAGRTGQLDFLRAKAQLQQLQATVPPLQARQQNALYRLATLTGVLPQDFPRDVADCVSPPQLTRLIPVGDGTALLRRRPDIRQNERRLAAATARVGVTMADLYPKITLGLSGSSAGYMSDLGRGDTYGWSLGPLISWTVPNTGAVQARIAQAQAGVRGDLARFDGSVLTAVGEVETALNNYARELDRHQALLAAADETRQVAEKTRMLYASGKIGYLDVLDAERGLAASDAALAQSSGQLADDQVLLFLALGGGWQDTPAAGAPTSAKSEKKGS
ncbi:TolC family protein [Sodalis sp. dw_96]|uniref:efflux transporter outer membrane subunit n=1 Tax=Sodalis sp. dw_96 TaxID=2719794 RepID=UPI001BD42810|nr:TolC family protein [Sodalis sp. dw_96]